MVLLYVFEDEVITAPDFSAFHLRFIEEALEELDERVRAIGGTILQRRGSVVDVLEGIRASAGIEALWSHEETGNALTFARDRAVGAWCREHGIPWHEYPQTGVIRRLGNRDGWSDRWLERMRRPRWPVPERIPGPSAGDFEEGVVAWPGPETFGLDPAPGGGIQRGGASEGERWLESFLFRRGVNYRKDMSSPVEGWDGCSRISPYLSWGCLSMRTVYQEAQQRAWEVRDAVKAGEAVDRRWQGSLQSFLGRLRWHCHFMQKLEDEPEIEVRNFNRAYDGLRENDWNEAFFQAWCRGETGYPMVDACMRCLHATGWINFRMRAMLVSFASYHLWLHWKRPAEHLARVFLDYEPGIHYSQVQMQSGTTGINSIRIYSPAKQLRDQDLEGVFVKRWLPELEPVPAAALAEPYLLEPLEQRMLGVRIGENYPEPIVNHGEAYRGAKERMYARKGSAEARRHARDVQQRHGSRRSGIPQVRNPS